MNIDFNKILKQLIPFGILALVAYIISVALYMFLPKYKLQESETKQYSVKYEKYYLTNSLEEPKAIKKPEQKRKVVTKKDYKLISNITLKAIYAKSNQNGWILIKEKSSKKTEILSVGDSFKDYKLKAIFAKYVIFTKFGKEYKLQLSSELKKDIKYKKVKEKETAKQEEDIKFEDDTYSVKKELISKYIKNPSSIFKQIRIKEIKKGGKIDGFRITGLSKDSIFKQLGLKKQDIIKEVNNIKLKSYNDAFNVYNKINELDSLNFKIERNNQELEIEYEIK